MITQVHVSPAGNTHSHIREVKEGGGENMRQLIANAILGGANLLGPMPNTDPELTTADMVRKYIDAAKGFVPAGVHMDFISIGYLSEHSTVQDIDNFLACGIKDVKIYPLNRTTKSENGVRDYHKLIPLLQYGGDRGMIFHFHPEHPNMIYGDHDAEWAFIPIIDMFLRATNATIVWEHGTDSRCIPFWKDWAKTKRFFLTITAHHLAANEDMSDGDRGSRCKPKIKTEIDRLALIALICKNYSWVMLGADDAPHDISTKNVHAGIQCSCGAYTAPFLLPLCAHALSKLFKSERGTAIFERFISGNARRFHKLPAPEGKLLLVRKPYLIPLQWEVGTWTVESFWGGKTLDWSLESA